MNRVFFTSPAGGHGGSCVGCQLNVLSTPDASANRASALGGVGADLVVGHDVLEDGLARRAVALLRGGTRNNYCGAADRKEHEDRD